MKINLKSMILGLMAISTLAQSSRAATITWTADGVFTDNTVLALAGTTADEVYGVDFGAGDQTTLNGYTFSDIGDTNSNFTLSGTYYVGSGSNGFLSGGGSTGDTNLDTVLNDGFYGGNSTPTGTLDNLTVGGTYRVLALAADTRDVAEGRTFNVNDGESQTFAFTGGTPAVGGYLLGTFVADANTQPFTINISSIYGPGTQYQAVLVELVSTPEPSTWALMLAGLGGLVLVARLRRGKI